MATTYNSQLSSIPISTLEFGKFVEIKNDSRFPAISVIDIAPFSTTSKPITSLHVYPRYATAVYLANAGDIGSPGGGGPITVDTITNPVTISNIVSAVTISNMVTAVTISNPTTSVSVSNLSTNTNYGIKKCSSWGVTLVSAVSTQYSQFPSNIATTFSYKNTTGATVFIGKWVSVSTTVGMPIPPNGSLDINLIANTNEIGIQTTLFDPITAFGLFTNWL